MFYESGCGCGGSVSQQAVEYDPDYGYVESADPQDITTQSPFGPIDWTAIAVTVIGFTVAGVASGLVLHYMGAGSH